MGASVSCEGVSCGFVEYESNPQASFIYFHGEVPSSDSAVSVSCHVHLSWIGFTSETVRVKGPSTQVVGGLGVPTAVLSSDSFKHLQPSYLDALS